MSLTFNPFDLLDENGGDRPRRPAAPKPAAAAAPKAAPKPAGVDAASKTQEKASSQSKTGGAPAKNAPASGAAPAGARKENDAKARPQGDAQRPRAAGVNKEGGGAPRRSPAQPRPQGQGQGQGQGAPARAAGGEAAPGGGEGGDKVPRERRDRDHRSHDRPAQRGRQFDRRSGTGRPANENKRQGSGRGNWGTIGEEGQETAELNKENEVEKDENAAPAAEGEVVATEPPKEPEKELLSLDEYLATKKNKPAITGVEAPKLRAAGEGVDGSEWANYAPLEKDDNGDAPLKKKKDAKKDAKKDTEKVSVDKLFRVTMPPHEGAADRDQRRGAGGPRGGKGPGGFSKGGRGGASRPQGQGAPRTGGDRKPKGSDANVALADQTQFPSLGGSEAAAPAPAVAAPAVAAAPAQSAPAPVKA